MKSLIGNLRCGGPDKRVGPWSREGPKNQALSIKGGRHSDINGYVLRAKLKPLIIKCRERNRDVGAKSWSQRTQRVRGYRQKAPIRNKMCFMC